MHSIVTLHESGDFKQARPDGQDVDLLRSSCVRYSLIGEFISQD